MSTLALTSISASASETLAPITQYASQAKTATTTAATTDAALTTASAGNTGDDSVTLSLQAQSDLLYQNAANTGSSSSTSSSSTLSDYLSINLRKQEQETVQETLNNK